MNDQNDSLHQFQIAAKARQAVERWLADFQAALSVQDPARIGALFHEDCH